MNITNVCVFCGSNSGNNPKYSEDAKCLITAMAQRRIGLVYGGGTRGLMGELAMHMKRLGGYVLGVSPKRFHKQGQKNIEIDTYYLVDTMHERKMLMYKNSQGFIALPGGIGTLDELAEIFTWLQIGFSNKPVAILNTNGYYNNLLAMLNTMKDEGFIAQHQIDSLIIADDPDTILDAFESYEPQSDAPWAII